MINLIFLRLRYSNWVTLVRARPSNLLKDSSAAPEGRPGGGSVSVYTIVHIISNIKGYFPIQMFYSC
jgi:hypothetical protein